MFVRSSDRVAVVLVVFIALSFMFEMSLHHAKHWLQHRGKLGMLVVLEKVA